MKLFSIWTSGSGGDVIFKIIFIFSSGSPPVRWSGTICVILKDGIIWKVKSDIIQCIHLCFCMLAISFYFVNCVIISCKLSFNSRFTRNQIPIMSFLGFKKAKLGCKMSELHLYVVKRQNWVVIIQK